MFGIKKNADRNNLSESDFYILDPYRDDGASFETQKKNMSKRTLLRGDHDSNWWKTAKSKGYLLLIYADPKNYTKKSGALNQPSGF